MKTDAILALEKVLDYCHNRWSEADKTTPSAFPNADTLTGQKMAYNDVLQFTRRQLADMQGRS